MGTDNLHHKRKARKAKSFGRSSPKRESYDRVLIICEGKKTEPNYFKELRKQLRLSSVNVEIDGERSGSSPINVVNYAIKKYKESGQDYDRVFCVFDKDTHTTYGQAKDIVTRKRMGKGHKMEVIDSIPCFEFWILLHFGFTTQSFSATGCRSICETVITELKKHIPDYEKGKDTIFLITKDRLNDAIKHANQVQQYHETSGTDNPSTKVHELVDYLMNLKN